jgi:putative transposase
LIARFGTLGRVPHSFLLRSDNGLVFTSRNYTALVRSYGLRQRHASRVIGDWISLYNNRRPHQSLGMKTPDEALASAA